MTCHTDKLEKFVRLLEQNTPHEGIHETGIKCLGTFKACSTHGRSPSFYEPAILIVGQGSKYCYVGDNKYQYGGGYFLTLFLPMPVESEMIEASPGTPFLAAGIRIDMGRMAEMLLRIEQAEGTVVKPLSSNPSGIFSAPLHDKLLDPAIRLLETLANPRDADVLGDSIVDELYYHILCNERGGDLRILLQQRGQIQRITKAVHHIHQNLHAPVPVDTLAEMVNMSRTAFYDNFREVMHVSPLQYAKSMKLYKAQLLIKEGKNVNEAGSLVGYNSPAQFSREYKRHFGITPSKEKELATHTQKN